MFNGIKVSVIPWRSTEVMGATGFFFIYCVYGSRPTPGQVMPIFSRLIFSVVRWSARRGLRDAPSEPAPQDQHPAAPQGEKFERKEKARRRGLLGETYGYWYLRRAGYVFI